MIFVAFIFVFLNGFFVLSEFSIVKVRRSKLEQLVKEKKPNAKQALEITSKLDTYLSACQLGITLSSLALGWIGEPAIAKLLAFWLSPFELSNALLHTISFVVAFSFITLLHVVVGELVPKSVAIAMADKTALWVARPPFKKKRCILCIIYRNFIKPPIQNIVFSFCTYSIFILQIQLIYATFQEMLQ